MGRLRAAHARAVSCQAARVVRACRRRKHLHPVVARVGDGDAPRRADVDGRRRPEHAVAHSGTRPAYGLQVRPSRVEDLYAVVSRVGYVDVACRVERDPLVHRKVRVGRPARAERVLVRAVHAERLNAVVAGVGDGEPAVRAVGGDALRHGEPAAVGVAHRERRGMLAVAAEHLHPRVAVVCDVDAPVAAGVHVDGPVELPVSAAARAELVQERPVRPVHPDRVPRVVGDQDAVARVDVDPRRDVKAKGALPAKELGRLVAGSVVDIHAVPKDLGSDVLDFQRHDAARVAGRHCNGPPADAAYRAVVLAAWGEPVDCAPHPGCDYDPVARVDGHVLRGHAAALYRHCVRARRLEHLHPVVALVGHYYPVARVDCHALRVAERAVGRPVPADYGRVARRGIEYLHAVVEPVGYDDAAGAVGRHAAGLPVRSPAAVGPADGNVGRRGGAHRAERLHARPERVAHDQPPRVVVDPRRPEQLAVGRPVPAYGARVDVRRPVVREHLDPVVVGVGHEQPAVLVHGSIAHVRQVDLRGICGGDRPLVPVVGRVVHVQAPRLDDQYLSVGAGGHVHKCVVEAVSGRPEVQVAAVPAGQLDRTAVRPVEDLYGADVRRARAVGHEQPAVGERVDGLRVAQHSLPGGAHEAPRVVEDLHAVVARVGHGYEARRGSVGHGRYPRRPAELPVARPLCSDGEQQVALGFENLYAAVLGLGYQYPAAAVRVEGHVHEPCPEIAEPDRLR